jgi:dihydroorotate dehydrogenase
MYKFFIRKILFLFPPELIHHLIVFSLKIPLVSKILKLVYDYQHPSLTREVCGLTFRNPVGLAAGFDKDAEISEQLADLGFGFIEVGTVTPQGQSGNPKPRVFRLKPDEALINRMGFNNQGVDAVVTRLKKRPANVLIAGNIGKNKLTPNDDAVNDYEICFTELYNVVDFFVINVSSPNTPNLRELQDKEPLLRLLSHLKLISQQNEPSKPLFLKIAPDLNDQQLREITDIIKEVGIDGIVATNTTLSRENLRTSADLLKKIGEGGLSGRPLRNRSTEIIRFLRQQLGGEVPIIGVGGIHSPQDALEKLQAGATLLELYTGFIYEGPALVKRINKALVKEVEGKRQKGKGKRI